MADFTIQFTATIEMTGENPFPSTLTTLVRPDLYVDGKVFSCAIIKTNPVNGIDILGKGEIEAVAFCPQEDVERFATCTQFQFLAGPSRPFATGRFLVVEPH